MADRIDRIQQAILDFRDARNWAQYHDARDLAMSISVEAGELLDLFLWQRNPMETEPERLREELADVFYGAFLLAADLNLDVEQMVLDKLVKNARKYPLPPEASQGEG